ncbi:MAG: NADP-dependent isocitrate dehydrogenase [Alphaproteobacteria bacterium]|nr:NADP-dependent isocitrate dehydrogenase [Alphaproteobacteria bacterium]
MATPITVAYGDGIGPEIMEATLHVLREAGAKLSVETIEVGERVYKMGATSGILPAAWESLKRTKVLLKAPITTPQGGGYKSLNVTMRKTLGLYANIRPVASYFPFVKTVHPKMDLVIVRENEEDLYAGIEHRLSEDVCQCLKLITHSGSERIIRYAFEYAVKNGRKKVTCMSKDNIMKLADGMFHKLFDAIGEEYPQLQKEHYIIDIGAARIAARPHVFDVIVTENLYGDIISDIAAEVSGSVGLAGSSNIGEDFAMFEAIHGSAPDIAGKNIANPSGILQSAVMLLVHIGQAEIATVVHNAWLATIEDGIHTVDIYGEESREKVGTKEFAAAVVERLGKKPSTFLPIEYRNAEKGAAAKAVNLAPSQKTELVGVDTFIRWRGNVAELGDKLTALGLKTLPLTMISSKGLTVWPKAGAENMHLTDVFCCRYRAPEGSVITTGEVAALLSRIADSGLECAQMANLYAFDGKIGFSLGQGE